jgi:hypothetical protein
MAVGSRLEDVMSDGSMDEDPVDVEMIEFRIRVGALDVEETVDEADVADGIVTAVVIVAPTSVVVA